MTSCLTGGYQKIQMCQIHSVIKGVYTKEEGLQLQQYLPDNKILSVTKIITYVDYGMNCVVYTGTPTTQARAFTSPWIVSRASLFFGGGKRVWQTSIAIPVSTVCRERYNQNTARHFHVTSQKQMEKDLTTIVNQAAISCGYEELKPEQANIIINKRRSPLLVPVPQPKQVAGCLDRLS